MDPRAFPRLNALQTEERGASVSGEHVRVRSEHGADLFRSFAEHLPELAWVARPDGYVEYYNRRWYEYTGTTFEDVKGWGWTSTHEPALVEGVVARWKRSLATGKPFEMEFPLRGRDGSCRWFLTRANPVFDPDGRIVRWIATGTDVDEKKRAERALRVIADAGVVLASALDYEQTVCKVAALAVPTLADLCVVDLVGAERIERAAVFHADTEKAELCRELRRFSGFGPEHPAARVLALGKPELVRDVGPAELGVWVDPAHAGALLAFGAPLSMMIAPLLSRGHILGVITWISTPSSARPFLEDDLALAEELGRRAGAAIDNAHLFESGQKERIFVAEANRAKDEFLAIVSHELRTPLNAILGWARMLKTRTLTPDLEQRAIDTIERNARAQTQLIEDLLDISRIITGKLRLNLEQVELPQIIASAIDTVRPAAEARGVRLQVALEEVEGTISGDADRLQQVVWNLLSNAVKFTPRDGRVEVRLTRDEGAVELSVSDTGKGIAPEFLPHVFERFRQEDGSVTRAAGGLGLGLAIVKNLVELHGGSVRAESPGDGHGATFVVRIPLAVSSFAGPPSVRSSARSLASLERLATTHELEGVRLLVVDDEPDARELLRSVLEQRKATVSTASSADEAYDLFLSVRPDVLISDIGMPGTDGYALMHRIRALPPEQGGRTPAVALTAFTRMEDRTRALLAGYNLHIPKPVEPAELVVVVANLSGKLGRA